MWPFGKRIKTVANLRVGKRQTSPAHPTHVKGVRQGNQRGSLEREAGFDVEDPLFVRGTPRRSTGINAKARTPIHPDMPNLSPS